MTNQNQDSKDEYLNDYAMYEYIQLDAVVAIFLGLIPGRTANLFNHRYNAIFGAIQTFIRNSATIPLGVKVKQDFDINGNVIKFDVYLSHDFARTWARTHGLKWEVPNYRPFTTADNTSQDEETETAQLRDKLTRAENEIEHLKAELQKHIEDLQDKQSQPPTVSETQDDDSIPCYLNKFIEHDPLAIAIKVRNRYWKDYSENERNKSANQIINALKREYSDKVSRTLLEKIEAVACPINRCRNK